MEYSEQLVIEAVSVGALLVPWTYMITGIVERFNVSLKTPTIAFISGATFHLMCEATGLNSYYLNHSAAQMLQVRAWMESCKSKPKSREKKCGICFVE